MDIVAAKPYAGYALKFKICRFLQMGVDTVALLMSGAVLISVIIVCSHRPENIHGFVLGKTLFWPIVMFLMLIHTASGLVFYLTKRLCTTEEAWKIIYATCNLSTSMLIQFAYLLGSHPVHAMAKSNTLCRYENVKPSTEHAVASLIASAEAFCQLASVIHFVAAFFPSPMFLVDVETSDGEEMGLDEVEGEDTIQLRKKSREVSFSEAPPTENKSAPVGTTEEPFSPPDPTS